MSLNGIMSTAVGGLQTAQTGMRAVSDNIANVNTPGYVRKVVDQETLSAGGGGVGVAAVRRAADQFLQAASLRAASDAGRAGAVSSLMDQAQAVFGDPSSDSSLFAQLDGVFSVFTQLAAHPSSAGRSAAVSTVQSFFTQAGAASEQLDGLRRQADQTIATDVARANQLLIDINALNQPIASAKMAGGDPADVENQQAQLIDQLSSLMDVRVASRSPGGVTLRTADGAALVDAGAATLAYDGSGAVGALTLTPAGGQPRNLSTGLTSGEIKGLLQLRDTELPGVQSQLAELTAKTADQLNAAHNAATAVPAPTTLTGRNTGLDLPTDIGGFTGKASVSVLDPAGKLVRRVAIDFDTGTMDAGSGPTGFTPGAFLSTLNTALAPSGSAGFASGALSLSATGANGIAVTDDATTPSAKAGRGFSAFFGLNDLVRAGPQTDYRTGLTPSDASPFTGSITLRLTAPDGSWIRDAKVTAPTGGTVADLVSALNNPASGVGLYGGFALGGDGELNFTGAGGTRLSVAQDGTKSGATGTSVSQLFGIGDAVRSARTGTFSVRGDIARSPALLALAQVDATVAVGGSAAAVGDVRGSDRLAQAGRGTAVFDAAGGLSASRQSLSDYSAGISASIARRSADADRAKTGAEAIASEATARRSSVEGVNLDEELVKLTTYQQSYNASARLIQAGKELYDVLLGIMN